MDVTPLPHLNAVLNSIATVLILYAFYQIKLGEREKHKKAMLAATVVSAVFLISYLTYHAVAPIFVFRGEGFVKAFYYFILISHVILAAVVPFLVVYVIWRALRGEFEKHKPVAKWAAPIWIYVSFTGVIVYLMLYHFHPNLPA